ncbi:MAG: FliO/MopB family protein [Clostridiales bacterium]|nr:FliO/MopB family protein [Clostridiales bacterium]
MDYNTTSSLLKLFVALPLVILLAYISLKFGNKYLRKINNGKVLNVIETVPVFNKAALSIVKIGKEYHVIGVTEANIVDIKILDESEIALLNKNEEQASRLDWKSIKGKLTQHD